MLKIALGNDHGGIDQKEEVYRYLFTKGYELVDFGTNSHESCDYPVYAALVAEAVARRECDFGIVICTSGEGVCMAANKVPGVRCGIGYNDEVARLMRQHNDANVIAFGAKFMDILDILRRIDIFLATEFEGGRHQKRVNQINELDTIK